MNHIVKVLFSSAALVVVGLTTAVQALDLGALTSLLGQLQTVSKAAGDSTLVSLAGELVPKAQALYKALAGNTAIQGQLTGAIQSLLGGKGVTALGAFSKLTEAKLTAEQMNLAKDVGNVGSAYLVQKNFAALEGAQGDVAQIVNALRKGEPSAALPALQGVAQNAKLTPTQKELAGALVDQYAPEVQKLGNALKEGLKGLSGFGK